MTYYDYKIKQSFPCGCHVDEMADGSYGITYCPMHNVAPKLYVSLKVLLKLVRGNGERKHHNLCYGLDVEARPDCELCKSLAVERIAYKVLAEAEGKE